MRERIQRTLDEIEASEGVAILYACESGSRAWGFASRDSDYDVRFVYLRPREWYLSLAVERKRDVIERPIVDELDINGWDLRKALKLLRKSNPPLVEWLGSLIVYRERSGAAQRMRELLPRIYSEAAAGYHYLHMAKGNLRDYLQGGTVTRKKYFYVLRPLLAIRWIEQGRGVVPTEFGRLVDALVEPGPLREAIDTLTAEKAAGLELGRGPRIPVISDYLESEFDRLEDSRFSKQPPLPSLEPFDTLFREVLAEVPVAGGGSQ